MTSRSVVTTPAAGRNVDALDFSILREILAGDTGSFRADRARVEEVAERLGVHRNTVSARIRRLTKARVFLPLALEVDPGKLRLVGSRAFLDVPIARRTDSVRERLFLIPGVFGLLTYHEGGEVVLYARSPRELARRVRSARSVTQATKSIYETHTGRDYLPDPPVRLEPVDVSLIGALLADARAPLGPIARQLGVSKRTLERRYNRLLKLEVMTVLPGSSANIRGMTMATLAIDLADGREKSDRAVRDILETFPNHFVRNVATKGRVHLFVYSESLADLNHQVVRLRTLPGVRKVTFRLFLGPFPNPKYPDWVVDTLRTRLGR